MVERVSSKGGREGRSEYECYYRVMINLGDFSFQE